MAKLAALLLVLTATVAALAQAPPPSQKPAQEMKKIDFLVGNWEGNGWMEIQGQKTSFTSNEKVQSKLDGTILTIEGLHKSKTDGHVVHNAFAVISYDERANGYRFISHLVDG